MVFVGFVTFSGVCGGYGNEYFKEFQVDSMVEDFGGILGLLDFPGV